MSTERFEKAVTKLYKAFHEGNLTYADCSKCAVGNIVGSGGWFGGLVNNLRHGEPINYGRAELFYPGVTSLIKQAGYSLHNLLVVENLFAWGIRDFNNETSKWHAIDNTKETQFKGLCAVVEYLCELDNILNIMDYSSLFEYDEQGAKKELQTVFP